MKRIIFISLLLLGIAEIVFGLWIGPLRFDAYEAANTWGISWATPEQCHIFSDYSHALRSRYNVVAIFGLLTIVFAWVGYAKQKPITQSKGPVSKPLMMWLLLLIALGMFIGIWVGVRIRYRDALDIALNVPWKVYCPWVDEVSLQSRITEYNEKLFKAYRVFNSGKGAYGIRARRYEFDGTPGGMAWLLIKDGKAESGRYDYWQSNPRSDKRMFVKWYGTAMKIGYYQYIPDVSKIGGYADKPEWVEDEHGLAITNVPYRIRFTAPTQWGGFYCPTRNKNG